MKPITELSECLRDSPKFRIALEESEDDIDQLEVKLDKMIKLCTGMVETGKTYVNTKSAFLGAIVDLSSYFKQDYTVTSALNKLVQALSEMVKYHTILIDQAQRSICKNLNNFVKNDIRAAKETKRYFDKMSDDFDQALIRNSQASRCKPHECEEVNGLLTATRACFQHTGLDYVNQLSLLQGKKRYEILDNLLSYVNAQTTFFHQGSDLCQDIDPMIKEIAGNLTQMREENADLGKQLDNRHTLVDTKEIIPKIILNDSLNGVQVDGYLFKRTSNAFKTWNRRWFIIRKNQLVYRKRSKDDNLTIMEEDLRLCSVKPVNEIDRRFCFEIVSPTKSHMLQADSQEMFVMWLAALQAGINAAIQRPIQNDQMEDQRSDSKSNDSSNDEFQQDNRKNKSNDQQRSTVSSESTMQQILSVPGNDRCCDCKSSEPRWASINLGITLCIECSGIHRSLGVHHSKVRSLNLDAWEGESVKIMMELGNDVVNKIYEANLDESIAVPANPNCMRNIREAWIKAKYIQKSFVRQKRPSPKSHLRRQRNVRKLSSGVTRRASLPCSEPSSLVNVTGGEVEKRSPSLNPVDGESENRSEKRSPSLNPDMNRKRSGCLFPELPAEPKFDFLKIKNEGTGSKDDINCDAELSNDELSDFDDDDEDPNTLLHRGASGPNIPMVLEALAYGADVNWVNIEDGGKTAIHQAITSGTVLACEYLFLNGAKNNCRDGQGRTPLHLATELGNTGQVCLLLKRGADQHALDNEGRNALSVAVTNANADIVTLLRIARFNDEMKESEYGNTDDTFNEVVRDFSKLASDNPERLKRESSIDSGFPTELNDTNKVLDT